MFAAVYRRFVERHSADGAIGRVRVLEAQMGAKSIQV